MSDAPKSHPTPEEIGGTGSVSAGSRAPPTDRSAWGTRDGSQPPGQAPKPPADGLGNAKVGGPGPGSGM
jgi:hypothetical protein